MVVGLCTAGWYDSWRGQAECSCRAWRQSAGRNCGAQSWNCQTSVGRCSSEVEQVVRGRHRTLSSLSWACRRRQRAYQVVGSVERVAWWVAGQAEWCWKTCCWNAGRPQISAENSSGKLNYILIFILYLSPFMTCDLSGTWFQRSRAVSEGNEMVKKVKGLPKPVKPLRWRWFPIPRPSTKAAGPQTWGQCVIWCACSSPTFCWYQIILLGDRGIVVWETSAKFQWLLTRKI